MNLDEGVVLAPRRLFQRTAAERTEKDWARIRTVILDALEPFPGAREAVVSALVQHCRGAEKEENDE